jgi:hypothetical protein
VDYQPSALQITSVTVDKNGFLTDVFGYLTPINHGSPAYVRVVPLSPVRVSSLEDDKLEEALDVALNSLANLECEYFPALESAHEGILA